MRSRRMIARSICQSRKVHSLSCVESMLLYERLILFGDDFDKLEGETDLIRVQIFPLIEKRRHKSNITESKIHQWLIEMDEIGLINYYEIDGRKYIKILDGKQTYHGIKRQASTIPDPPKNYTRPDGVVHQTRCAGTPDPVRKVKLSKVKRSKEKLSKVNNNNININNISNKVTKPINHTVTKHEREREAESLGFPKGRY